MKGELSSLDLYYLIKELKQIENSKIDKVFQKDKKIVFQTHSASLGKKYLSVLLPGFVWLSEKKEEFPDAENFAMSLRKHITNSIITSVSQLEFERIIKICLDAKETKYVIYIELFRPGNIILCNKEDKVVMAKEYKGFGSRMIRPNIKYDYPKKDYNLTALKEKDLVNLIEKSDKGSIVITMAVNLGLGGLYSEELCARAGIDKKKTKIDQEEIKRLYHEINRLKDSFSPSVYYENDVLIDITPIEISAYTDKKHEKLASFNAGLGKFLDDFTLNFEKTRRLSKYENEKKKIMSIIKGQEAQIKGLEKSAEESQTKGEAIYSNYSQLNKILEDLNKARKSLSLREIKEKLKGHKIVKELDEKDKKILLEI
jgi:predicted ribosome quality control (RQC) complex YloA/Tae2 family protein